MIWIDQITASIFTKLVDYFVSPIYFFSTFSITDDIRYRFLELNNN